MMLTCNMYSQSMSAIKKEADNYFNSQNYSAALPLYKSLMNQSDRPSDVPMKLGIVYIQLNEPDMAAPLIQPYYEKDGKDLDAIYYLAKISQQKLNFSQAIDLYKYYLKLSKSSDPRYRSAIDDLKRSSEGNSIIHLPPLAYVENLGKQVNSSGNELCPVWSPNHSFRIYFSADQQVDTVSDDSIKIEMPKTGKVFNLFGSSVANGIWSSPTPMNINLLSNQDEILSGFNPDGRRVYYSILNADGSHRLLINEVSDTADFVPSVEFENQFVSNDPSASDFYFFSDSTLLFASAMPGGWGGYDLYVTHRHNNNWTAPENLGPEINSDYDERFPYLAHDGRTIFYSSNNLKSMGGFDLFTSRFDDDKMEWPSPQNLGTPFNSPSNDVQLRISETGLNSLFVSDRPGGSGGFDLYSGYFKTGRGEQGIQSLPASFNLVKSWKLMAGSYADQLKNNLTVNVNINSLYYTSDESILVGNNKKEIDDLATLMSRFPGLRVNLLINSFNTGGTTMITELFFGIKRLESIVNYLSDKGIAPHRVILQSVGAQYPIAKTELAGKPVMSGINLNKRIDVKLMNTDSLPLKINYILPVVNDVIKDNEGDKFKKRTVGLSYRLQIISLSQMYKGDMFVFDPDLLIESSGGSNVYKYMIGLVNSFSEARRLLDLLKKRDINDAFIVPYINNVRINKNEIDENLIHQFPDLNNFIMN